MKTMRRTVLSAPICTWPAAEPRTANIAPATTNVRILVMGTPGLRATIRIAAVFLVRFLAHRHPVLDVIDRFEHSLAQAQVNGPVAALPPILQRVGRELERGGELAGREDAQQLADRLTVRQRRVLVQGHCHWRASSTPE